MELKSQGIINIGEIIRGDIEKERLRGEYDLERYIPIIFKKIIENVIRIEREITIEKKKKNQTYEKENYKNGTYKRYIYSSYGKLEIDIPRYRGEKYSSEIIPSRARYIGKLNDEIISLYSLGMSLRDISKHIKRIKGIYISATKISEIINSIVSIKMAKRKIKLKESYSFIFLDAIHMPLKVKKRKRKIAVYNIVGIDLEGNLEILGLYPMENPESSNVWKKIVEKLKRKGIKNIKLAVIDGLNGFEKVLHNVFPEAKIQRCIVHQARDTIKKIAKRDYKAVIKDCRKIYTAPSEKDGYKEIEFIEKKWKEKYPNIMREWKENWNELKTFFSYDKEVRKTIYTTNIVENINKHVKKILKNRGVLPNKKSLKNLLYLSIVNFDEKIELKKVKNYNTIVAKLSCK